METPTFTVLRSQIVDLLLSGRNTIRNRALLTGVAW